MKEVVAYVEDDQYERFAKLAEGLGTTPERALRDFVHAFNEHGGFPFPVGEPSCGQLSETGAAAAPAGGAAGRT